ncbi:hypothetical protein KEM56_004824, partial [Ascosphaera pollenicola]
KLLAPITPTLVEESWQHAPENIQKDEPNPLLKPMVWDLKQQAYNKELAQGFPLFMAVNTPLKIMQETARNNKAMGSSLQSFVHVYLPCKPEEVPIFQQLEKELCDLFVVSKVSLSYDGAKEVPAEVKQAQWRYNSEFEIWNGKVGRVWVYAPAADKCPRCWKYNVSLEQGNQESEEERLCGRCEGVMEKIEAGSKTAEADK